MITILDYGLGNLGSVKNAFDKLNIEAIISADPTEIDRADGLIFPGVGAAGEGMKNLRERNLDTVIKEQVRRGKPLLGICLGMQLLFSHSEEGDVDCLDLIPGRVKLFQTDLKVPQMGWNQVISKAVPPNSYFYFVHSYYCEPEDNSIVTGTTDYGQPFCSMVQQDNLFGVQFHPEKSGDVGLQLLQTFYDYSTRN